VAGPSVFVAGPSVFVAGPSVFVAGPSVRDARSATTPVPVPSRWPGTAGRRC